MAASTLETPNWMLEPRKRSLIWLNAAGGLAVLGSYAHGLITNPALRGDVWGGVPESLQPLYTVSMFTAAAGYFPFTWWFLFRFEARPDGGFFSDFRSVLALYTLVLIPSALWMPLTFQMLEAPGAVLWVAIRVVLAFVGIGSVGLLAVLWRQRPGSLEVGHALAVAGCIAFCFQTAVLDATVWPAYFPF